ncbi:MAG: hypothetical protein L0312_23885 [Acidobacteria bacterium]|nr:hypothetical protein [Acidobacteriota bacterium]
MGRKAKPRPGEEGVQVFELTMDNSEDQDELNRRLNKPGEVAFELSQKTRHAGSTAESIGKKNAKRKGTA